MEELQRRVLRFVNTHGLLQGGEKVLVGLSGGPDSVALSLVLLDLSQSGGLPVDLHLAHLNHGLRGAESDADEGFCRQFALQHGLQLQVERADLRAAARPGASVEAAARRARYAFLGRAAEEAGAQVVATAHHADDVAETVLLRLIRGAALTGLGAIAPKRALGKPYEAIRLVRPLMEVRKAELVRFLEQRGQAFRRDSSNLDAGYTRNRVRHELIPALARSFPTFSVRALCALNESALETRALVRRLLDGLWDELRLSESEGEVVLDEEAFARAPLALRKAATARVLEVLCEGRRPPALAADHYSHVAALPHREVGHEVSLPGGFIARHEHGVVYFSRRAKATVLPGRELPVPGNVDVPEAGIRLSCEVLPAGAVSPEQAAERASDVEVYLALDVSDGPLTVRGRSAGDRFQPLGLDSPTSLKDFLIARKVPRHERGRTPLVATRDGEIAWVVGHRIGERFRLRNAAGPIVRLRAVAISEGDLTAARQPPFGARQRPFAARPPEG